MRVFLSFTVLLGSNLLSASPKLVVAAEVHPLEITKVETVGRVLDRRSVALNYEEAWVTIPVEVSVPASCIEVGAQETTSNPKPGAPQIIEAIGLMHGEKRPPCHGPETAQEVELTTSFGYSTAPGAPIGSRVIEISRQGRFRITLKGPDTVFIEPER